MATSPENNEKAFLLSTQSASNVPDIMEFPSPNTNNNTNTNDNNDENNKENINNSNENKKAPPAPPISVCLL